MHGQQYIKKLSQLLDCNYSSFQCSSTHFYFSTFTNFFLSHPILQKTFW